MGTTCVESVPGCCGLKRKAELYICSGKLLTDKPCALIQFRSQVVKVCDELRHDESTFSLPGIPIAKGFAKNGIGDFSIWSKTNFSSSGDISEPSAKCNQ